MASDPRTVEAIVELASRTGEVTARKMFGEYALYRDGKLVALVCDDTLYLKPTSAGRTWLGEAAEGSPYPGAKPCFIVPGERWDDGDWLAELIRLTAAGLPEPTKKKR